MGMKLGLSHKEGTYIKGVSGQVSEENIWTKEHEVPGGWRKLYNEEFHCLYSSPDIYYRMIKSRRMRWVGHVAHMGTIRNA
jgi:hypothetical protein